MRKRKNPLPEKKRWTYVEDILSPSEVVRIVREFRLGPYQPLSVLFHERLRCCQYTFERLVRERPELAEEYGKLHQRRKEIQRDRFKEINKNKCRFLSVIAEIMTVEEFVEFYLRTATDYRASTVAYTAARLGVSRSTLRRYLDLHPVANKVVNDKRRELRFKELTGLQNFNEVLNEPESDSKCKRPGPEDLPARLKLGDGRPDTPKQH